MLNNNNVTIGTLYNTGEAQEFSGSSVPTADLKQPAAIAKIASFTMNKGDRANHADCQFTLIHKRMLGKCCYSASCKRSLARDSCRSNCLQSGMQLSGGRSKPRSWSPTSAVMARQYLGCPASSAVVERLFSKVGIDFTDKHKRSQASHTA